MEEHEEGIGLRESCLPQVPYVYKALPNHRDIRLLSYRYLPDKNEVTIQCSLITKSLDDIVSSETRYWALSYVWGNPNDAVAIICDGKRLSITRNLHALLVNLFQTNEIEKPESGYIWADAICINQVDDEEKTLQVRLMQDVFSHADRVVAWLGKESESVKSGFAFVRQVFATMKQYVVVEVDSLKEAEAEAVILGLPGQTDKVWGDIAFLLSNPWFSRVWVVQEALMAKTLTFLCGTMTLPADILLPFADHMVAIDTFLHRLSSRSLAPWFLNASYLHGLKCSLHRGDTLKIFEVLRTTRNFEASDARDKVYAIVGLTAGIDDTFIDYSQKDPVPMLVRLAKYILGVPDKGSASCPPLKMLGYAASITTTLDVPSWVADWTSLALRMKPFEICSMDDDDLSSSDGEETCQLAQVTDDNGLLLRGQLLDHVESLASYSEISFIRFQVPLLVQHLLSSDPPSTLEIEQMLLTAFEQALDHIRTLQKLVDDLGTYPTGETLTDVLWRSLLLDDQCKECSESRGQWARLNSMLMQCIDLCHKFILFSQAALPAKNQEILNLRQQAQGLSQTETEVSAFVSSSQSYGRSFSSTKRGYVGWMPETARKDDELWVFHGCPIPFVLRPVQHRQDDEQAYRLIGHCYLHGLMRSSASSRIAGETQQIKLV